MPRRRKITPKPSKVGGLVKKVGGGIGKVTDAIKKQAYNVATGRNFKGEKLERISRRRYRVVK